MSPRSKLLVLTVSVFLMVSGVSAFGIGDVLTVFENSGEFEDFSFGDGEVALIQLEGVISPSSPGFGTDAMTPEDVRRLNDLAEEEDVDAIVYEINSGGGAVVASKDVRREIESVDVPTVCRFKDVSASGAYLASLGCDEIVSDSMSFTGSVGVTASYLEFSGLMEELGIEYVEVKSGESKEIGSQFKNTTEEEVEILEGQADTVHEEFLGEVVDERNLTGEQRDEVKTGKPILGKKAKELGLVDHLGGREKSIEVAENLTGRELEPVNVERTPEFGMLDLFMGMKGIFDGFGMGVDGSRNPIQLR